MTPEERAAKHFWALATPHVRTLLVRGLAEDIRSKRLTEQALTAAAKGRQDARERTQHD